MLFHFINCLLVTFSFTIALGTLQGISMNNISKPGCPTHCGNVTVPYPFGIGKDTGCSLNNSFHVTCNLTSEKLFLRSSDLEIINISDLELRIKTDVSYRCYNKDGTVSSEYNGWNGLLAFTFSQKNKLTVIGCDDYALITDEDEFSSGCIGLCSEEVDVPDGQCSGKGCCQTSIAKGLQTYDVTLKTFGNHTDVWSFNYCGIAFLGEEGSFQFRGVKDLNNSDQFLERIRSTVPVVLDWVIGEGGNCTVATECKENSHCYDVDGGGYRCRCNQGYEGNPYLDQGCQDINECDDMNFNFPCYGTCINNMGNYTCKCKKGHSGNPTIIDGCRRKSFSLLRLLLDINECDDMKNFPCYGTCINNMGNYTCKCKKGYSGNPTIIDGCRRKSFSLLRLLLGIGLGFLTLLIGSSVVYYTVKKRKLLMLREKFFEQNGGVLLEDKLKNNGGMGVGSMKIFRVEELKVATGNYAEDRILGKGGNGIVYKGTLPDKRVVAIKKSQRLDEGQREQFINEMIILTQINHQNVVQLLGCCLETDVPLLAYEFVSNDTLYSHIHNRTSGRGRLSWDTRLRIAHESASALAYLHTDARMSIIHRDVKSTNILLDENYTAKIADFGASRLVPLGHDEVTTLVQGTFGYLDPEYFHSGHLTDKSDVYSFGVVLAELITGKKPLSVERCLEDRNLATYFVKAKKENRMLEIVDRQVVNEATNEHLKAACDLVCRCLNIVGGNRPSMKEVTMELETLRKLGKHAWISQDNDNETSSLIIESEEFDLYPRVANSDTFGEYSSSSTSLLKEIMLQVQDPR